jgi:Fe-S cluster biogenesis protein NfuA
MSFLSKLFNRDREISPENLDLWQRVEIALDRVRPMLQADGGDIELIDVSEHSIRVKMTGACSHCSSSRLTLDEGVERVLRDEIPEFKELIVQ